VGWEKVATCQNFIVHTSIFQIRNLFITWLKVNTCYMALNTFLYFIIKCVKSNWYSSEICQSFFLSLTSTLL
jgi:hypothetical protein